MICAISKKSEYLLAELIQQMIKTSGKYELDDVIKQVYERVKEQTKNEDTALAYAGLVPSLALKIFVYNPQLRKQFKVSMDKIDEKIDQFSDFENVKAQLLAKKPVIAPLPVSPQPGESDDYQITGVAQAVGLDNSQRVIEAKRAQWSPRPSYWATTGTDVFYGRTGEGTGIRQEEVFHFNVLRKILSLLKTTDVNQRTVNVPGVGPVYLKAVQLYSFAATEKVKDNLRVEMDGDKMVITNTNQDSTWSPSENDIIYALVDKAGNYVYFDQNGNVTKDKENGRVPYYSLLSEKKYMDFMESIRNHNSYIKFNKLYTKLSDSQKKDIDKVLKGQMMLLQSVEKYAKDNPGSGLMFSIWGGAEGRIAVSNKLSEFDFSTEPFRPDISKSAGKKNSPYFTNGGKVYYFKSTRGLLAEDASVAVRLLFEKVYDAKTKKALTPLQKRNLLASFFYPGKINENQGNVLVNIDNFYVELNDDGTVKQVLAKYDPRTGTYESKAKRIDVTNEPNVREIISDILGNWTYYHVSSKYITQGSNFILPRLTEQDGKTVVDISQGPQDYPTWLQKTDKFNIEDTLPEEPYLLLEPTPQTYDNFMGTPSKPTVKMEYTVERDENGITYGTQDKLRDLHNKGLALYTMRVSKAQAKSNLWGFKGLTDTRHFGNPFTDTDVPGVIPMQDTPTATAAYEAWLDGQDIFVDKNGVQHDISNESARRDWINEQIKRLREKGGVTLGYFKKGYRSHAAVLAERINKPAELDYDNPEVMDLLNELQAKSQELQVLEMSGELEEQSVAVFTAKHLPKIKPESAVKEAGGKIGSTQDINPSLLSKKGVGVQRAAEQVVSMMRQQYQIEADEQEVRDYIIEILTVGKNKFLEEYGVEKTSKKRIEAEIKRIETALEALRQGGVKPSADITERSEAPETRTDTASEPGVNDREDPLSKAGQDQWNKIAPLKSAEVPATKEQLEEALRWYEEGTDGTGSVFKKAGIPFRTLFNIFNSDAVATFSKAGITLYAGSDYSDIYHESWHAFTFMFLTQEQREKLWNEIRKYEGSFTDYNGNRVEFSKATDDQIEEYLAEDFRKYMLSKGTKIDNPTPQKKSIFKKIYDFLKTLYGDIKQFLGLSGRKKAADVANNPLEFKNIKELYENIRIGNLGGMTRRQDVRDFGTINKSIRYLNEMDDQKAKFSHADTMLVFETIESVMSRLVDRANEASGNSRRTVTMYTDEQNRQKAYGYVYDQFEKVILPRLQDKLAQAKNDTTRKQIQKKIDLVKDVLENFGNRADLKENAKLGAGVIYFHMMHSKIVSDEAKRDFFEDELDRKEQNLFEDKGPQDTALEELAGEDIVRLIRSLNQFDKKGKIQENAFGEPKLMEFKDAFSRIMKVTLGSIDKAKMLEKMIAASERDPLMRQLLGKLGDINSPDAVSQKLWTNFWQAFNKSRVKLAQHTVNEEDKDGNVSYNMTVGYADGETKKVERKWSNDFQGPPTAFIFRKTGQYKGGNRNYLDIKLVLSAFPNVDVVRNDPEKAYQFLKSIGVVMTDSQLIKDLLVNVSVYKETIGFIHQQLAKLSANDITVDSFEKIFEDHRIKGGENIDGIMKRLNYLTQLEASQGTSVSNYMVSTATGDTAFEVSLNNTMLVKTYYINEAESFGALTDLPHMNHLDPFRTPFTRTSVWRRSMFDQNGQRRKVEGMPVGITVDNLSGIKMVFSDGSSEGVATLNSGPYEKFLMEFHSVILRGSPELSRHGDKKTSNSARVQKVQSYDPNKVQDFKFIDDVDFILDDSISAVIDPTDINSAGNSRFFEIMLGYMYSEMDRMRIMREMPEDAVFDHKYRERGMDFVIFERMLSKDVKEQLTSIATNTLLMQSFTRSSNIMETFRNYLMSERPELYNNMRTDVHDYLRSKVEEVKEFMPGNMRFIDQQVYQSFVSTISKKTDKAIAGSMLKRENITEALFHSYVTNAWINAYETSVWFYGDPAQYDQWQKRIQGEASTGDLSATDAATIQYIKSKGRPYTEKMLPENVKPFEILENGIINSAVLADSKVDLPQKGKIEKALRKYYEKVYPKYAEEMTKSAMAKYEGITEGDGQAWVSFDGYRAIKFSQGKWFDYHEDLYQRIVAGENIDAEKIEQFFPVAKWQHMGPMALMEGLPMNAMYKFSVFPLIPNVIKDRTLNTLHMKMMEQGVDLVLLKSGSKIANLTRGGKMDPFYTDNKTRTFNSSINFLKTPIFLHYLKDQQETGDEYKKNVTLPTQQRVLITDDLFENGVPLDFKTELSENKRIKEWQKIEDKWDTYSEEKKEKVSPMYKAFRNYKDHVDSFTKVLEMQLLRKIGWRYEKGVPTGDTRKLMEYVVRNLNQQDVASHLLDFIKVNEKGELSQDLSLSLNSAQIQKLMHALVNKEIIRQKANGQALVQVSRMGWEKPTQEQYEEYRGGDLPFYDFDKEGDNTKAMKVKIALQGQFRNLLNHPDVVELARSRNIDRLKALNMLIKDEAWLNRDNNRALITMVSTRIPVQGMNSMDFMEVAEFLPQNAGGIIIMPESIVGKSGSDFDIDKMFTIMPYILSKYGMVDFVQSKDVKSLEEVDKLNAELMKKEEQKRKIQESYKEKIRSIKAGATEDIMNELQQIETEVYQRSAFRMNKIQSNIDKFEKLVKKFEAGKMQDEDATGIYDSLYDAYQDMENLQNEMDDKILRIAKSSAIRNLINERNEKLKPLDQELFSIYKSIQSGSVAGITNGLITSMKQLMERPENFINLIVPNSTDILDPVVDKMVKYAMKYDPTYGTGKVAGTTLFETPFNLYVQQTSSVAKRSLGIAAVGNVSKVRMNQIGMHLTPTNRRDMTFEEFKEVRKEYDQIRMQMRSLDERKDAKKIKELRKQLKKKANLITAQDKNREYQPFMLQRIMMDHNQVEMDGQNVVSLAGRFSKDGSQKTADVHNQIINVAVDVVKDPRAIFTIQGNLELIPVLELLIDSGVDLDTAVMFLTQPLIQEYKNEEAMRKGPLSPLFGLGRISRNMIAYEAKFAVFERHDIVDRYPSERMGRYFIDKLDYVFKTIDTIDRNKKAFSKQALEDRLKSYYDKGETEITDADKAIFLHFLELQQMAKAATNFKLTMNPDKSRAKNLFQVQERQAKIEDIRRNQRVPEEVIDREYNKGLLSSFYRALNFQQQVFEDYFRLDNNKEVLDFMKYLVDTSEDGYNALGRTGYESEEVISKAVNDFKVNLFQMALYDFDINDMDSYRGYQTSTDFKVVAKRGVVSGVYFQDGVAYVDKKKLELDYNSVYNNLSKVGAEFGFAEVNKSNFPNAKDYYHFVFEREYLRHTNPLDQASENFLYKSIYQRLKKRNSDKTEADVEKMAYEEYLRDRALKNVFNLPHLFRSPNSSMADMLEQIKRTFPDLVSENGYAVLRNLDTYFDKNGSKNIRLYDTQASGDMQTSYQEELMDLMDPLKMEKIGDDVSMEDKMILADFFSKLPIFSVLQSGFDLDTNLSIQSIMPQDTVTDIMQAVSEPFIREQNPLEFTPDFMDAFVEKFLSQNQKSNGFRRNFKDYVSRPTSMEDFYDEQDTTEDILVPYTEENKTPPSITFEKDAEGKTVFVTSKSLAEKNPAQADKMVAAVRDFFSKGENQNKVLVFNDVYNPKGVLPSAVKPVVNNPSDYTNHSGGAQGSDTQWDVIGKDFGMVNNKHYFTGERGPKNAPLGNVDISGTAVAIEGATKVAQAAKEMWGYKYATMKDQRLIRNWAQVLNSDAVFAIGTLGKPGDIWKGDEKSAEPRKLLKYAVQGGTGYAVEMAIQAGKPVYLFDQERKQWYKNIRGEWSKTDVPKLTENFAGIGTREINEAGKQAIRDVYTNTFKTVATPTAPATDVNRNAVSNDWILRKLADEFPGNIVGIPTRAAYSGNYSVDKINETDEKYNTALSAAMDNIEDLALQGKEIIFNKAGYAQNQIGHSDNDASPPEKNVLNPGIQVFDKVSKDLFRRFGYENPNFMKKGIGPLQFIEETQRPGIEEITGKRMPTHEEIMNKLKSCSK